MANQSIDPNGVLRFMVIFQWIAKRNRYVEHRSESAISSKGRSSHTFTIRNEPVTISVILETDHVWAYYEAVLNAVANICEMDFNNDNDYLLAEMQSKNRHMEVIRECIGDFAGEHEWKIKIIFHAEYGLGVTNG